MTTSGESIKRSPSMSHLSVKVPFNGSNFQRANRIQHAIPAARHLTVTGYIRTPDVTSHLPPFEFDT